MLILCIILSTHVLAQPNLFEYWSLERIVEGWAYYFVEVSVTGFAMLAGCIVVWPTQIDPKPLLDLRQSGQSQPPQRSFGLVES